MRFTFVKLFFCLIVCGPLTAQTTIVKKEDVATAEALKKKYPKEDIVGLTQRSEFSFDYNESKSLKSPVTSLESVTSSVIAVKDNSYFSSAVFHNDQSEVLKLKVTGDRGKTVYFSSSDDIYQQDGIFHSDAKIYKYGFPLSTRGEKANYEYQKRYYDVKYLTSVYFHESKPLEENTIVFNVPSWLTVELKEINFAGYTIAKTSTEDPKKKMTTHTYVLKNIPAYKAQNSAPNIAKNYPHILVLCKSYKTKEGATTNMFNSLDDLYSWYHGLIEEMKNNDETLKPVVADLTKGKKTDIEKIEAIYYWVQENIRYIAFENGIMGFKPETAQNVCKNKYGDCKGKANLMKHMLGIAGFEARLTWIGTTDIPYDYSIPSLAVDNHMICTLVLGGKRYFLDGTEEYIAFNDYAHRIQGRPVLIEDGAKYFLDKVPEFSNERNKIETTMKLSLEGEVLKGNYKSIYNGEEKTGIIRGYSAIRSDNKEEALKKFLSSDDKNIKLSNITTSSLLERQKPLEVSYDFELSNYVTKAGGELYINIDREKEFGNSDFDSTRINDYEFGNKILRVSKTEFTVPEGYKVDYLPEAVNKKHPDFSFKMAYTQTGNKIVYDKTITIDNAIIRLKDIPTWNMYVKEAKKFYNDQIVLVKK